MPKLKNIPEQVITALDQLVNALTGGWADETLSARAWRRRVNKRFFAVYKVLNGIFFWQDNHCKTAYENEKLRKHAAPEMRD